MITTIFKVVGRGIFPIERLHQFKMYPADVETAERIAQSIEESIEDDTLPLDYLHEPFTYRLGMNTENFPGIVRVIVGFVSVGFAASVETSD